MARVTATITLNKQDELKLKDLITNLKGFGVETNKILAKTAQDSKEYAKRKVKEMDAYDTGRLYRGIQVYSQGSRTYILESEAIDPITGQDYAETVHEGLAVKGKNSKPRPYLQAAAQYFHRKFVANVRDAFRFLNRTGKYARK